MKVNDLIDLLSSNPAKVGDLMSYKGQGQFSGYNSYRFISKTGGKYLFEYHYTGDSGCKAHSQEYDLNISEILEKIAVLNK